jgi:hypothetical protein
LSLTSALYRHSTVGFAALLLFAVMAFWPRYLAQPFGNHYADRWRRGFVTLAAFGVNVATVPVFWPG